METQGSYKDILREIENARGSDSDTTDLKEKLMSMRNTVTKIQTSVHLKHHQEWKIDEADLRFPFIQRSGLSWTLQIPAFDHDVNLLKFLYKAFTPWRNSFKIGEHRYMITFEDVLDITGLRVDGPLIVLDEVQDPHALCVKILGKAPDTLSSKNSTISLKWLRENFMEFNNESAEQFAKAYLLHTIGSIIFPDTTGGSVASRYLSLLEDINTILAWGVSMLTQVLNFLRSRRTNSGVVKLAGCALLLMCWGYERFLLFRPSAFEMDRHMRKFPPILEWACILEKIKGGKKVELRSEEYLSSVVLDQSFEFRKESAVPDEIPGREEQFFLTNTFSCVVSSVKVAGVRTRDV